MPATVTFHVQPENAWLLEIPADEVDVRVNTMLYMANKAMQTAHAAPAAMSSEETLAFQRVYDMLQMAIPRSMQVQQNSSVKGTEGERSMDELIVEHFPHLKLTDCSGAPHGGDRQLLGDAFSILLEYKDYARTVDQKEVDKFTRDVRESGCDVGVFCSFGTRIVRKHPENLTFESVGAATVIYVPCAGRDGKRLLGVLEWAQWYCRRKPAQVADAQRLVDTAVRCLGEVDSLYRDLSMVSDQLKKQLQRLDEARLTSLTALRERLQTLASPAAPPPAG